MVASIFTDFTDWIDDPSWTQMLLLLVFAVGSGALVGALVGGVIDRRASVSAGITASVGLGAVVLSTASSPRGSPVVRSRRSGLNRPTSRARSGSG